MAGKIKITLAIVALLAVVSFSAYLMQRENMGNQASAQNPRTVTLNVSSVGEGRVLVNGSAAEQVKLDAGSIVILEASAEKYWRLREWRVNGTPRAADERLVLFINGPTQVEAVFERVMVKLVILENASPASVAVNGTVYQLPYNASLPAGTYLEIAPVAEDDLVALDKPVTLKLEEDTEITLRFRKASNAYTPVCRAEGWVLVDSEAAKWAIVNGENRTLPVCVLAPAAVRDPFQVPLNETHSLWLAWYWVEQNGTRWWWSYGLNGSTLYLEHGPANVTLHYVLGLKDLPYVERVYWHLSCYYNCTYKGRLVGEISWKGISDGWYLLRDLKGYGDMRILVDLADANITILELQGVGTGFRVKPVWRGGFTSGVFVPLYTFCPVGINKNLRALVRINFSAYRMAAEEWCRVGESFNWSSYEWEIADQISCTPPNMVKGSGFSEEGILGACPPDHCKWGAEPVPIRVPSGHALVELGIFWRGGKTEYFRFRVVGVAP